MKNINFIQTPTPKQYQQLYRWYRISGLTLIAISVLLISITGYQWYTLASPQFTIHPTTLHTKIQDASTRIKKLEKTKQTFETQRTKLTARTQQFAPGALLKQIAEIIPDDTCLYTAQFTKKGAVQLTGYTTSAHSLRDFMNALTHSCYFNAVQLSSLQPDTSTQEQLYRFSLTAQLQSTQDVVE